MTDSDTTDASLSPGRRMTRERAQWVLAGGYRYCSLIRATEADWQAVRPVWDEMPGEWSANDTLVAIAQGRVA